VDRERSEKDELYRDLRLEDQITWYASKARQNVQMETRWFWTVFCVEFGAIVLSALQAWQLMKFSSVSGMASFGTALIA
jgi:hypothetical protein